MEGNVGKYNGFLIITHYTVGTLQKCLLVLPTLRWPKLDYPGVQTPPRTNFFGSPVVMTTVFFKKNPRATLAR